jgi:pimeloyl-ACP methyl ester carboxylesterase
VCHPGGPGFSSRYLGDLAGLGERLTLVLLNPRGSEGSGRPDDPRAYGTADYVADLEELRRHLGLERLWLLGHSHGGVVAQAYAAAYPARIDKLVLASTLARFAAEQEAEMERALAAKAGEPWYEDARAALEAEQAGEFTSDAELGELALREFPLYFARFGETEAAYLDTLRGEAPCADALKLFNAEVFATFDLRGDHADVAAPTLVLTGEEDFITGPVCARELAAGIAGAELAILPGAGHFVFVEAGRAFREAVLSFLFGDGAA